MLTAVEPLTGRGEQTGTIEEIRAYVRKQKTAGADLIKVYASGGMRQGGMTLSQDQLNAACDEAKRQGLRLLVHAYREAVHAAIVAGCTQVEHGLGATDDDLKQMAAKGIYFDPQAGFLIENYVENREKFAGTPFFPKTPDGFESMRPIVPMNHDLIRQAIRIPGLKIVVSSRLYAWVMATAPLQIGQVAERTGLSVDAIRFYEKSGLLPRPRRTKGGYRLYDEQEIADVEFIQKAQQLGFSLNEIGELFSIQRHPQEVCVEVRDLIARKLITIRAKIAELQRLEGKLESAMRKCRTALRQRAHHRDGCPVLTAMSSRAKRGKYEG